MSTAPAPLDPERHERMLLEINERQATMIDRLERTLNLLRRENARLRRERDWREK